jgi:hypothetical protein
MPKAIFVKKAQKPNGVVSQEDIDRANNPKEPGDETAASYWHWSMKTTYGSVKRQSKRRPRPSQMTLSEFWGNVLSLQEEAEDASPDFDDLESWRDEIAGRAREIGEECREKFENMPEGLQQGSTGELLEQRADSCEGVADEIEGIDVPSEDDFDQDEPEDKDGEEHQEWEEALDNWKQEEVDRVREDVVGALSGIEG